MIFLIEYDRPTRRTLRFETFLDNQRRAAQDQRLSALSRLGETAEILHDKI